MAVTKLWSVTERLGQVIDYATNPEKTSAKIKREFSPEQYQALADVIAYAKDEEKTEREFYVEGINCNVAIARDQFITVKEQYQKTDGIVSPAYFMFEVVDNSILNEDYLMMWFRRPEFDRICWLHTDGSVRGGITWDDICRLELPIPPIEKQLEIVNSYKAITERIALKKKINDNLEATVQAIFKSEFIDYERANYSDYIEFEFGKYPATWNLVDLDTAVDVRDAHKSY